MNTINKFVMTAFAAAMLMPTLATAQDSRNQSFLTNAGSGIVRSGTGLCWGHRDADQPSLDDACNPKPIAMAAPVAPAPAPIAAPVRMAPVAVAPVMTTSSEK